MARDLELSVEGVPKAIAQLEFANRRVLQGARKVVRQSGRMCRDLTKQFCPVKTYFMRDHVTLAIRDDALSFEVGWLAVEFYAEELEFYPPYVEYGTGNQTAQPSLRPAFAIVSQTMNADIRDIIRSRSRRI